MTSTKNIYEMLLKFSKDIKNKLSEFGIDEIVVTATSGFATIWFYSQESELTFDLNN